jgi:hypothetical protein
MQVNYSEKELFGPLIQAYVASLGGAWNEDNKKSVTWLLKSVRLDAGLCCISNLVAPVQLVKCTMPSWKTEHCQQMLCLDSTLIGSDWPLSCGMCFTNNVQECS